MNRKPSAWVLVGLMLCSIAGLIPCPSRATSVPPADVSAEDIVEVRYARRTIDSDLSDYEKHWQGLLQLALEKSGVPYRLVPVDGTGLTHARIIRNVNSDWSVNIAYMGTSPEFEQQLQPIRVPVFRGLIGYRILMIRDTDQERFSQVKSIVDLHGTPLGLGIQWSDVPIMRDAGFNVVEMPYTSLFKALAAGRFDAVSRAAHEIGPELMIVKAKLPRLTEEKSLVIAFRQASYFFVAKNDQRLAGVIRQGLLNAYDDGSFMDYFDNSPVVQRARQILDEKGRRLIWLENRYLSEETRNLPARFWFSMKH